MKATGTRCFPLPTGMMDRGALHRPGPAAGTGQRVYFTGYTVSALGTSEFRPGEGAWQLATVAATSADSPQRRQPTVRADVNMSGREVSCG